MFVQVIQGKVSDPDGVRRQFDRWMTDLRPGAKGWLGSTGGVTDDGQLLEVARFESEEAARANSERPEQDGWWQETSGLFDGDVTFHDCRQVELISGGGSDDAGFVQVIQGRVADPERLKALTSRMGDERLREHRPEIVGGLLALADDGWSTQVVYFTSEEEARRGESQEPPEDIKEALQEMRQLVTDMTFLDLRDPWLYSP